MLNFTWMTVFILCSLGWSSRSVSECQTVEVQPGEEATLLCSNLSENEIPTFWLRLDNGSKISCISVMFSHSSQVKSCDGYSIKNYEMSINRSTVSLKIKEVELSDSGLYFCGVYKDTILIFNEVRLNIKGSSEQHDNMDSRSKNECDVTAKITSVILFALTVGYVMVIIGLVVKIRKLQTDKDKEQQNPEQSENVGSEDLNYAAVAFQPKAKGSREVEPNVIYSAIKPNEEAAGTEAL